MIWLQINSTKNSEKIPSKGFGIHLNAEIKDEIFFWLQNVRDEGVPVNDEMLSVKAISLHNQTSNGINNFRLAADGF